MDQNPEAVCETILSSGGVSTLLDVPHPFAKEVHDEVIGPLHAYSALHETRLKRLVRSPASPAAKAQAVSNSLRVLEGCTARRADVLTESADGAPGSSSKGKPQ